MTKKVILVVAIVALVALAVPAAYAATTTAGQQLGLGLGRGLGLNLNLTDDQQTQLQAIRDNYQTEIKDLVAQRDQLRTELRDLRRSGADQTQIDAKTQELTQVVQAIQDKASGHLSEIKAVLTPEQIQAITDHAITGFGLGFGGPGKGAGSGRGHGMGRGGFGPGNGQCPMWGANAPSTDSGSTDSGN